MENLDLNEVAKKLNLSVVTLRRYIKSGRLKAVKVGREYFVKEEEVDDFFLKTKSQNEADALVSKALNDTKELKFHVSRKELMHQAIELYKKSEDSASATEANYDANIFAYSYTNIFNESKSRDRWGRFAPTGTMIDKDGKEHYFPDPAWIDKEMLKHASKRLTQTQNPIVLAIYYDLLFEHSKEKDKRPYAHGAIDNYLKAVEIQYRNDWDWEFVDSLVRAFELAHSIGESKKRDEIILLMYEYVEKLNDAGKPRMSLELFDVLIKFHKYLTSAQKEEIIKQARIGADFFGNKKGDNRHLQRSYLETIEKVYRLNGEKSNELNTKLEQVDSYILEADEKSGSGLVEANFLEEALKLVKSIGDPRKDEHNLKTKIEKAYLKAESEMTPISVEINITEKDRQGFLNNIFVEDNVKSLERISSSRQLIQSVKSAEKLTKDLAKKYPLQHIFGRKTIQQGRKITSSEGGFDVTEDHIIDQLGRNLSVSSIFLAFVFEELKQRGVGSKEIIEFLREKEFYQYENFEAIVEGIQDFEEKKYYSALCILVPQIEEIMRRTLREIGYPTMKLDQSGFQRVITIVDILDAPPYKEIFDEDIYWYFRLILYDKRGLGLRDNVAHGLLRKSKQNKMDCYFILHLLLILSALGIKNKDQTKIT